MSAEKLKSDANATFPIFELFNIAFKVKRQNLCIFDAQKLNLNS
jgi:hypothetical protein